MFLSYHHAHIPSSHSMPISSPPLDYLLNPTGTSGISCGPEILIVDDALSPMGVGLKGNILIRGTPCFGEWLVMCVLTYSVF